MYYWKMVLVILPQGCDVELQGCDDIPRTYLRYDSHEPEIPDVVDYQNACRTILDVSSQKENRNVLIFCNNGYQRSLPFLCYYLTIYHSDEMPNIRKALQTILSQVDKENFSYERLNEYETMVSKILES